MKDFEDLVRTVVTLCSPEEQERLREMEDWIVKNDVKHHLLCGPFRCFPGQHVCLDVHTIVGLDARALPSTKIG